MRRDAHHICVTEGVDLLNHLVEANDHRARAVRSINAEVTM
jgi:hypothetical protein